MKKQFEVKPEHIKLLQHAEVSWNDCEFGAPSIDCKRPYGNSSVIHDMYEILNDGQSFPNEDDDSDAYYYLYDELEPKYKKLHKELQTVLEIVLHTLSFETGWYEMIGYGTEWKKIDPPKWLNVNAIVKPPDNMTPTEFIDKLLSLGFDFLGDVTYQHNVKEVE